EEVFAEGDDEKYDNGHQGQQYQVVINIDMDRCWERIGEGQPYFVKGIHSVKPQIDHTEQEVNGNKANGYGYPLAPIERPENQQAAPKEQQHHNEWEIHQASQGHDHAEIEHQRFNFGPAVNAEQLISHPDGQKVANQYR